MSRKEVSVKKGVRERKCLNGEGVLSADPSAFYEMAKRNNLKTK
jgi:hypothetical protein